MSSIAQIQPGSGRISVGCYGEKAIFSQLSSTYPLKLLSPQTAQERVAVAYILSYGGGLVGGDQVNLAVDVGDAAALVLLSQGSTKVFKSRPDQRMASVHPSSEATRTTTQRFSFEITAGAALFLLPDPVTCFRDASYNQIQTFTLGSHSSLILLDWITSGRKALGENWAFSRYYSVNEVIIAGKRVAKDVMLLESERLAEKLAPYSCYATLILCGPLVHNVVEHLAAEYSKISVMKCSRPAELLWSMSPIDEHGTIVRIAGRDTEIVKRWLAEALVAIVDVVGLDIYQRALK
ncbi:UreD urease accessory protein-domain-containing protein [Mycena floridula]|nr:UreD urease accessory protein-domain-containing protein [Mycena floridula]